MNQELKHYGVLGMHWGVRRYQDYPKSHNGSGTFKGKVKNTAKKHAKRSATAAAVVGGTVAGAAALNKASNSKAFKPGKNNKPSSAEKAVRGASDVIDGSKRIVKKLGNTHNDYGVESKSNAELDAAINRLRKENEYVRLMDIKHENDGKFKAEKILDLSGDIASVAGGAAGVAAAVYKFKHSDYDDDILQHHGVMGMKWGSKTLSE